MKNQKNKNKKYSFTIYLLLFAILLLLPQARALAATYYVDIDGVGEDGILGTADDVISSDANPGTSEQPWKTIARAYDTDIRSPNVEPGDTVYLRNGNYGKYSESLISNRNDWITYKAATGHTPVFTQINVTSSVARNAYLKFDGINIQHPNWTPATGDDGDYHAFDVGAPGYLFSIVNANYVQLLNGKYEGYYMWISRGAYISNSNNVTIKRCEITNFNGNGLDTYSCNNFLVDNCYLHKMVNSSCLRIQGNVTGVVWQNNHINYENATTYAKTDPYFPHWHDETDPNWDGVTKDFLHTGSGVSIRSSNITVRNNIIRGYFAQGLMFYTIGGPFHDMIIENNLFYNTNRVALGACAENIIVRNNTLIGCVTTDRLDKYGIIQRYSVTYLSLEILSGYDSNTIGVYNNIFVNEQVAPSTPQLYKIGNNIFWRGTESSEVYNNNFRAVWVGSGPNYTLHGWPNFIEDIGFRGATPEYDYSRDGIQPFFVNPGLYFGIIGNYKDSGKIWDYHLAQGSPGINFGDPNNQPSDSLGSIGPDGFIRDDGPARDATHHSAGCYEYGASTFLYGDVSGDGQVTAYDAALTAQAAVGLIITLTPEQTKAADVSGNGEVSAYDAALIAQKAAGLSSKEPFINNLASILSAIQNILGKLKSLF